MDWLARPVVSKFVLASSQLSGALGSLLKGGMGSQHGFADEEAGAVKVHLSVRAYGLVLLIQKHPVKAHFDLRSGGHRLEAVVVDARRERHLALLRDRLHLCAAAAGHERVRVWWVVLVGDEEAAHVVEHYPTRGFPAPAQWV